MALIDVINNRAEKVSQVELRDDIYDVPVKPDLMHSVVRMQLAARRSGTASVRRRSDIRGSQKKLFRQKGTGRARRGNIKSPLLRGGGVVFGPEPRSYAQRVPKKVKRLALKMALSSKLRNEQLMIVDDLKLERIKTRDFTETLDALAVDSALIVTGEMDRNLDLSSRNVPGIKVLRSEGINVYDVLKYDHLVLLESCLEGIERRVAA